MAKDQSKNSTQPTRRGPSGRGRSNIGKKKDYIPKTKAKLGDEQALRDHAMRHRPGSASPCTLKKPCDQYVRWKVLEWLKFDEIAALFGPDLRELQAKTTELVSAAARSGTIEDSLIAPVSDGDAFQMVRDCLANEREIIQSSKSLVLALRARARFSELLVEQPLHDFRELATSFLGILGYRYQDIAYLVDAHLFDEGDGDRTRKSRAWRAVEAQRKEWGKCPPKKPRVQRDQGDQPDAVSVSRPETPPDATSARAERTAIVCPPAGAQTPPRRRSERRVEQVEHLVDGPALDQELDRGPRNV
jgi:hypothetical protein